MTEQSFQDTKWYIYCCRATEIYTLLILSVFPLFTGFRGYILLLQKKHIFFLTVTMLWLLSILYFVARHLFTRGRVKGADKMPRSGIILLCVLAFSLSATVSTLLSPYSVFISAQEGKYDDLLTYLLYGSLLLGVTVFGIKKRLSFIVFAVAYTICCGIAAIQLLDCNVLGLYPAGMTPYSPYVQETGVFLGTLGNVDAVSAYHCLALPLFVSALFFGKEQWRWLLLVPIGLGAAVQIHAGVASGLLAVGLTVLLLVPGYVISKLSQTSRRRFRAVGWFGGAFLFLLALLVLYIIPFEKGTLYELHQVLHGHIEDSYGSHRILIWRKCAEVFREHPVFGIGPDCLEYYLDIFFERESLLLGWTLRTYVDTAHNTFLQLLLNFGVIGCIPLSALLVETADGIRTQWQRSQRIRILLPPFLCYLIQAFFNIGTCMIVPLFLVLWGTLLSEISCLDLEPQAIMKREKEGPVRL